MSLIGSQSSPPSASSSSAAAAAVAQNFKLRPFQAEALGSIWELVRRARKRAESGGSGPIKACCVQPTGSGKTVELLCLVREVVKRFGWRSIAVEPTRELVRQTVKRAGEFIPECSSGVFRRGARFEDFDLVLCTAGALNKKALSRVDPSHFQIVFIDEAHHAASETYELILNHFTGALLIIGLTATYLRGDSISIASEKYFESVVVYQTIGQLTQAGYLTPAIGNYFHTGLVLENVPIRKGNYDERKLAHAVNTPERNAMVVEAWEKQAAGRRTLIFTADIQHAKDVAAAFESRGIRAAAVWGKMDPAEYVRIMEKFRAGEILGLANSKLLSEGFDEAAVSACILARPGTEAASKVLGPQMIGRALRLYPGKKEAVIIELVDKAIYSGSAGGKSSPLSSLIAGSYGVSTKRVQEGEAYLHEQSREQRAEDGWRERLKMYQTLRSVEAVEETFDVIERVSQVSEFAWLPLGLNTCLMPIGEGGFVEVVYEHVDYFEVRAVEEKELKFIGSASTLKDALNIADAWVVRHGVNLNLQVRSRPWRKLPPRDGQIYKAHKVTGLPQEFLKTLTRGQLSDLITSAEALLLPFDGRTYDTVQAGVLEGSAPLHMWQFESR